jgi:effector-binding domain-containing protein
MLRGPVARQCLRADAQRIGEPVMLRRFRLPSGPSTFAALTAVVLLAHGSAWAQTTPPPSAPPSTPPATQPPPEIPAPPAARPTPPADPAAPPASATPNESFGQDVVLTEKTIIYMKGSANWDTAFETLVDAFKQLSTILDKQGLKESGPPMTIYTSIEDTGFQFQAAIPIAEEPKTPPQGDVAIGKSPGGKAVKFVHKGSYDSMDATYEQITNYMDERRLESKDMFIEEYATDLTTTPEDKLVINVLVPINEAGTKP